MSPLNADNTSVKNMSSGAGMAATAASLLSPAGWISTGLTVLGGVLSGLTAKTPKIQRSARDSILMTMAKRYNSIRKQRETAAGAAALFSGLPVSKFTVTPVGMDELYTTSTIYNNETE